MKLTIDNQLKIQEVCDEVKKHNDWFEQTHGIVVLGERKFLDKKTMTAITLPPAVARAPGAKRSPGETA